jgi:hypothetical protein
MMLQTRKHPDEVHPIFAANRGMQLLHRGFSPLGIHGTLGDIPAQYYPATDAQAAGWCAAMGKSGDCGIAPGVIDFTGMLHITTDPSGQPCQAGAYSPNGPCTWVNNVAKPTAAQLQQVGITPRPISQDGQYPNAAELTQAQTIQLLTLLFGSSTPPPPPSSNPDITGINPAPPASSIISTFSSQASAAGLASQIQGASVVPLPNGQFQVVAPGYGTPAPSTASAFAPVPVTPAATPAAPATQQSAIASLNAPAGTSGTSSTSSGIPTWVYLVAAGIGAFVLLGGKK